MDELSQDLVPQEHCESPFIVVLDDYEPAQKKQIVDLAVSLGIEVNLQEAEAGTGANLGVLFVLIPALLWVFNELPDLWDKANWWGDKLKRAYEFIKKMRVKHGPLSLSDDLVALFCLGEILQQYPSSQVRIVFLKRFTKGYDVDTRFGFVMKGLTVDALWVVVVEENRFPNYISGLASHLHTFVLSASTTHVHDIRRINEHAQGLQE